MTPSIFVIKTVSKSEKVALKLHLWYFSVICVHITFEKHALVIH